MDHLQNAIQALYTNLSILVVYEFKHCNQMTFLSFDVRSYSLDQRNTDSLRFALKRWITAPVVWL